MKNILAFIIVFTIFSCKEKPKNYVTLSGEIINHSDTDVLTIFDQTQNYSKIIKLKPNGTFKDTLKVKKGMYIFKLDNLYGSIYLKNNNSTSLSFDKKTTNQKFKV